MNCKCNCSIDNNATIQFIRETTVTLLFKFNVPDLSSYEGVHFSIRKNYETAPVIDKTITDLEGDSVPVVLSTAETALFTDFQNNKNSSQYIWGLDLIIDDTPSVINIFPKTGKPAPICIVYKNVVEEE